MDVASHPSASSDALAIWLVRHGDRERTAGDPGLTDRGRMEARAVAEVLAGEPVAAVYSSPLRRAHETAEVFASRLGLPCAVEPDLRERANWGDVPGEDFEAFTALWERCSRDRDYAPPSRDSARAAGARLHRFMERCVAEHGSAAEARAIVAVTHGGLIADFLVDAFEPHVIAEHQPAFDRIFGDGIATCSVTRLVATRGGWRLSSIGAVLDARSAETPGTARIP